MTICLAGKTILLLTESKGTSSWVSALFPPSGTPEPRLSGQAVTWLATQGIRQFIDVGCGLPTKNGSPHPARTESFLEVEHPIEARAKGSRATSLAATLWSSPAAVLDGQVSMSSPDYRSSASSAAARAAPSVVTGRYDTFLPISAATTSARCPGVMSA